MFDLLTLSPTVTKAGLSGPAAQNHSNKWTLYKISSLATRLGWGSILLCFVQMQMGTTGLGVARTGAGAT